MIQPLSKNDIDVLGKEKKVFGRAILLFSLAVSIMILLFGWNRIFYGTNLDRLIFSIFWLLPITIGVIVYLVKNIDFLVGKKRLITGCIEYKHTRTEFGDGGTMDVRGHYLRINNRKYSVNARHYGQCEIGDKVTLHRTLISRSVFKLEKHS